MRDTKGKRTEFDLRSHAVTVGLNWLIARSWSIGMVLGSAVTGELSYRSYRLQMSPGVLAAVTANWRAVHPKGWVPFVDLSASGALSWNSVKPHIGVVTETLALNELEETLGDNSSRARRNYFATDLRLGARVGWSIGDVFFPYVLARGFGGPAFLGGKAEVPDLIGSDTHFFQIGAGASGLIGPLSLYAEWSFLGEGNISGGFAVLF
jgi:hypothetical protein